jgi:hypothetical protein
MPCFCQTLKKKNMKYLVKISSIICFVVLLSSCDKDREKEEPQTLSETNINYKAAGEDDDILFVDVPKIHGQVVLSLGEESLGASIVLTGTNISYEQSLIPDTDGYYSFDNLQAGSYQSKTYIGGVLSSVSNYIVSY